jgi:sodium/pantothenate symporter
MGNMMILIPMILYLLLMFGIAIYTNSRSSGKGNFMEEYFIGGRSMGGFVLAMTLIATYSSASSFVGGPGVAYSTGYAWILLSMIQVPTAFLTLGILGKKFAIISRKINAVTVTDYLKARYDNHFIAITTSIAMIVFFSAAMVAQFIGGAKLFEAVTGYSYVTGLIIFGISVILYTTIGGFKAVVITDAIQGIVMVLATTFLLVAVVNAGGGVESITAKMIETNPNALTPTAGGAVSIPFILSFWVLVGFAVLGLPQTTIRCMGFKDSKSLHNAMVIGTVVVGFLMLGMHLVGALGAYVVPGLSGDGAIPDITVQILSPVLAGIFIAGPLAAIMSTVDSMLILASASIIKDLYLNYGKGNIEAIQLNRISLITTGVIGLIVFVFAIKPPSIIVWINLFAFGGLEAAFFWPTILGLYWKKANADGAMLSIILGIASFFIFTIYSIKPFGMHQIVPTLIVALIAFVIGSLFGRKNSEETIKLFWEE